MCGIYGVFDLSGNAVDPGWLAAMGSSIVHRGPDDHGMHVAGPCAIGMRRLSIIDLAGGHQPISNADDSVWVVCNGEIYNFRELRSELEQQGYRFKTHSDTEVVLHGYAHWGADVVLKLNGMFAFAVWDARAGRLLVARDRLGIKPLYVYRDARRIAFASEAKSLLMLPGVAASIDPTALSEYLHLGYVPAPFSIFGGISKLPPATVLSIERGGVTERRYWLPPSEVDPSRSEDDWVGLVRERIDASVRMQMVADVPMGAFLSGGVDSSAVVACMSRLSDRPIKTYAIGFEGGAAEKLYNELPYARRVADLFGTEHHEIIVKPDVVSLLPKLAWHMDEPIADSAFVTTFLVSQFARQDVTVILSGVGGDELFGGYRRYLGEHYLRRLERVPRWLRRSALALGDRLPADRHSSLLNVSRLAKGFLASADMTFEDRYRSFVQVFPRAEIADLLKAGGEAGADALLAAFGGPRGGDALNRMLRVDTETQLPDDLLLLTDKMTMATSLECRVPLLDHELVELGARIPESIKVRGGRLKHVMKRAFADTLPADILDRKKRGFGTPMGAWLRGELSPVVRELLAKPAIERRGWLNHEPVARLVADHAAKRVDGTDRLLALLSLEVWARLYLDRRTPDDLADELKAITA